MINSKLFDNWYKLNRTTLKIDWDKIESYDTHCTRIFKQEISRIALKYAKKVYKQHINVGSLEYSLTDLPFCQVLAIAGTNEKLDWFWNFILLSWYGIKLGAYLTARKLNQILSNKRDWDKPLLVTAHSRGGASAPAYYSLFCNKNNDHLVYFNPCPSVRGQNYLDNTIMYYNKYDIVHYAGEFNFNHWNCADKICNKINQGSITNNHILNQWDSFVNAEPISGLCSVCKYEYPHCTAKKEAIIWKKDEIIACYTYRKV